MPDSPVQISVSLTDRPIDQSQYESLIESVDIGAIIFFHGVTRQNTVVDGQTIVTKTLHYEAHHSMALSELQKIAAESAERFGLLRVLIVHRLGEVPVGQTSVLIGCGGPHRRGTIEAVAWIMDTLKRDVPIWKCELDQLGAGKWVHPN